VNLEVMIELRKEKSLDDVNRDNINKFLKRLTCPSCGTILTLTEHKKDADKWICVQLHQRKLIGKGKIPDLSSRCWK
jgi:ribosomal protein S27AE